MTQVRKLKSIPRPAATPRAGFHPHGDLLTKADVLDFIEGYANRMRSLSHNTNIPRAQCRVAQQNASLALRLLNAVRQRSEKDMLDKPVEVFAELDALMEREAAETGVPVECADVDDLNADADVGGTEE